MGAMRSACSLCGSGHWPDACFLDDVGEGDGGRVCVPCGARVASLILEADDGLLADLWLVPRGSAETSGAVDVDAHAVYRDMGLLEDALLEAATAYWEINDPEVRQEALVVVFGLLRDGALPRLQALLYPV